MILTGARQKRVERASRCLKGLAHPIRLAILMELKSGPASVGELEARLGKVSQSNLSQHLSKMQGCGILKSSRERSQIFYEVADERVFDFLALIGNIFCKL